jgi:hypothetical protein
VVRPLIHPRMLDRLQPSFYPSRVTIEAKASTRTGTGAEVPGWTPVPGLVRIPAAVAPEFFARPSETRGPVLTVDERVRTVILAGLYSGITTRMRALVDGAPYEITGAVPDSHATLTRLSLRQVAI